MKQSIVKRVVQALALAALVAAFANTSAKAKECPECACAVYCNLALISCSQQNGTFLGCDWNGSDCVNQGCQLPG